MSFADLKPQIERLPHDEKVQVLVYLKSRLRADSPANREELARRHAEMDTGRKVQWEALKQQLGLT